MRWAEAAAARSRPDALVKSRPLTGGAKARGRVAGVVGLPRLDLVVARVDVEREEEARGGGALGVAAGSRSGAMKLS